MQPFTILLSGVTLSHLNTLIELLDLELEKNEEAGEDDSSEYIELRHIREECQKARTHIRAQEPE